MSEIPGPISTAVLALFTAGAVVLAIAPVDAPTAPPFVQPIVAAQLSADGAQQLGPAQRALADEIIAATQVTEWPELVPSMDDAIAGLQAPAPIAACGQVTRLDAASCSWGDPAAPKSMMVLGNSVAMTYVQLLKNFAEASDGQWKVSTQAMFGCEFIDIAKRDASDSIGAACPGHKEAAIAAVNQARPDVVVIANQFDGAGSIEWTQATERLTSQFASNVGKIVFLAAPPGDTRIGECYNRINGPADCIGKVTQAWLKRSRAVQSLAAKLEGTYIDPCMVLHYRWLLSQLCRDDSYEEGQRTHGSGIRREDLARVYRSNARVGILVVCLQIINDWCNRIAP